MSMQTQQVCQEIAQLLNRLSPQQLESLYNQLHADDHIVHVGNGVFEHQDMED